MIRKLFVWLHRWTGLLLAGFLIFQGLTGSLRAFDDHLERLITPQFYGAPKPGAAPLDLAGLAESAAVMVPQGQVNAVYLGTDRAVAYFNPRKNPATGEPYDLGFDQFFLDPWSGKELGRRRAGDIRQGIINLMPFIDKLHRNLALGSRGALLLGVVALCWTIDCFVGFYLTLPVVITDFWRRWQPSWLIKRGAGFFRLNFDLHRAGGLWLWPMLIVFAWSGVMFNLPFVYKKAMHSVLEYKPPGAAPKVTKHRVEKPQLDSRTAQATGEKLIAEQAASRGFAVVQPIGLYYEINNGLYGYVVQSSRDPGGQHAPRTSLTFDGDSGSFVALVEPDLEKSGDKFDAWMVALHRADVFGLPYRIFVCALGLVIVMLSVTGICIWRMKRRARMLVASQRSG